eukprot:4549654-Amphidinium_carterae.1
MAIGSTAKDVVPARGSTRLCGAGAMPTHPSRLGRNARPPSPLAMAGLQAAQQVFASWASLMLSYPTRLRTFAECLHEQVTEIDTA